MPWIIFTCINFYICLWIRICCDGWGPCLFSENDGSFSETGLFKCPELYWNQTTHEQQIEEFNQKHPLLQGKQQWVLRGSTGELIMSNQPIRYKDQMTADYISFPHNVKEITVVHWWLQNPKTLPLKSQTWVFFCVNTEWFQCFVWTLTIFLVVSFIVNILGSGILSMVTLDIEGLISADPWANFWPTSVIDWYVMTKFVIQHCTEPSLFLSSLSIHFSGPWHSLIRIAFPKPSWSPVWFLFHQIIQMDIMLVTTVQRPGDCLSGTLQLGVVQFNSRNTNIVLV